MFNSIRVGMILSVVTCLSARADPVTSAQELRALPKYCWGTQQIREVSKVKKPFPEYIANYGQGYNHFHHYCWALNSLNNGRRSADPTAITRSYHRALSDIEYSLSNNSDDKFVFLPLILATHGSVLNNLGRSADAARSLAKAIQLKPNYTYAYMLLATTYEKLGDRAHAVEVLKRGYRHTQGKAQAAIKKRLSALHASP
jgi:tetratricopeptide (TPR) repeat protein